ncbi:MAG: transglutaminaseTgpA domain-containing protein [Pseudomonadota bacterium]
MGYQIPRNTLALLMFVQVVVVFPYLLHLSPWIIGVALFCGYWRAGVYQGRWDYPRRWVKTVLVLSSVGAVAVSGAAPFSPEAAASLLVLAFALKLIEMKSRRDAYLVIFLAYFAIATAFLFDQSIGLAAYQLAAMTLVTAAMVGLNQAPLRVRPLESVRLAGALTLQAVPLTVVVFLLFPRVAPLWNMPLPSTSPTGISDRVTPGDVARLSGSDELAFRAQFEGAIPARGDLYWRGLVYSRFRGGTWSAGPRLRSEAQPVAGEPRQRDGLAYEVLLEPTQQRWLFALETPGATRPALNLTRDYRLEREERVSTLFRYRVVSYPGRAMDAMEVLPERLHERETALPSNDNPRIRRWARELWARTGSPGAFVDAVLETIRTEDFFYTLGPPTLDGAHSIDAFWFDTRRGFCTHFAGAVVFMLRSVGVPARMVGGYQGGEVNPVTGHLVVRQYDAHAWAEYWVPGGGWRRVDPTAAVAPARVERGLEAALSRQDRATLSAAAGSDYDAVPLLRQLAYWADSLEHRWNLWVVGYDTSLQAGFLDDLLGDATPARIALAALLGGGGSLALVAFLVLWRRRPPRRPPVERAFLRFCAGAARAGWVRAPDESPGAFVQRLAAAGAIGQRQADLLVAELERLLYNPAVAGNGRDVRRLQGRLRNLRLRLLVGAAG